uniref:T-complex 11, testis-specific-like 1 n=1 Tax=Hucho hucho TaxID=62062 RepID=A0A4W5KHA9_9TELE
MPNDSDKPGGGEDKGTEDRTDSSQQSLRKRSCITCCRCTRFTASPPRFVSVEELMETAKGLTNMALPHEIVVNTDFQVKPSEPDLLETQLSENPPSYDNAIKLLAEIKEIRQRRTLLSFLLPGHGWLRVQIEEVLDLSLIQQKAENGALDISKVVEFVIGMMGSLCAPSRDKKIRKLLEITDLVPLLNIIQPHLLQQSVEYERKKFQEFVEKQLTSLLLEDQAVGPGSSPTTLTVHNHAYLNLKWDHASDPFPETLLMDQVRFQEMQQDMEQLVLVASVLLIVYNTIGEVISGLPGLMARLKRTTRVLLTEMHMPSFRADEALSAIGERMCGFSPFSTNLQSILKGQISAVTLPDNTIRKLIDSRIRTYLLAFLESSHRSAPTLQGGVSLVSKELEEIAMRFGRLVHFNKLFYSTFYLNILQEIVQEGKSHDT